VPLDPRLQGGPYGARSGQEIPHPKRRAFMKRYFPIFNLMLIFGLAILVHLSLGLMDLSALAQGKRSGELKLPPPDTRVRYPLKRPCWREGRPDYKEEPLTQRPFSILWAPRGITEPKKGLRTTPSARAFLNRVYVLPGNVTSLRRYYIIPAARP